MKRVISAIVATFLAGSFALLAPTAHAYGDEITRFDITADVDRNGVFTVTQTVDLQFAGSGHGLYAWFLTRQTYSDDMDRLITYSNFRVSSPTGAPTNTDTSRDNDTVSLRIGDPNVTVSGTQTYVITYTASGIVNPNNQESNMDEIYWTAVPTGWEIPISNVSVTINGPSAVSQTTCWTGRTFHDDCTSHASNGSSATFTQTSINPGEGLAVVGGWPVGSYPGAKIDLVPHSRNPFDLSHGGSKAAGGAGVLSVIAAWFLARFNRKGRDEQFANVTPGMLPVPGDKVEIKYAEVTDAPVEFAPPEGVPPRLAAAIVREGVVQTDITATIIDMAVRGYIHFQQGQGTSFTLSRTNSDPKSLNPVEADIYKGLFSSGPTITSTQMSTEKFYSTYTGFLSDVQEEFNAQQWYKSNPGYVISSYRMGGLLLALIGGGGSLYIGTQLASNGTLGFGWLAIPFVILGLGMAALAKRMPVRTPVGSAVAIKSFGFKKYLETAEAKQIKWEETQDIFSKYLPYAIGFGCADHWASVVKELVAMGAPVPQPTWYTGYNPNYPVWMSVGNSIDGMGAAFSKSISAHAAAQAASVGASGGSGFSGGGGGVGGGGGGSW